MTCPRTEHILQQYFADDLTPLAAKEIDRHLSSCSSCKSELDQLLQVRDSLEGWQDERIPHWDRGMELYRSEHPLLAEQRRSWTWWQWMPTGVSMVMLLLMLLNFSVTTDNSGITLAFGGNGSQPVIANLEEFQQQQQDQLQAIITRFEEQQDTNNLRLMQAVLAQSQQVTAENLDRIYAYFEEQRRQDMASWRIGYQQLADSDYATIQSLQDLAQYVSFQDNSQ